MVEVSICRGKCTTESVSRLHQIIRVTAIYFVMPAILLMNPLHG